ncbi:MAG: thioredoxin family protein, partial [Cytophagales bacterium CG18_big_fil_WC_8_21_14_2_50_42_9]
ALADKVPAESANLPLIPDPEQEVSRQFGATKTPEAFLLQNQNGSFVLKYKGAIDDNPQLETSVRQAYLQNALIAVLANKPVPAPEIHAIGCMIKKF